MCGPSRSSSIRPTGWPTQRRRAWNRKRRTALAGFQGANNLQRRIAALLAFDATPHLGAVRLPTLLMAARDDVLVPSSVSEELAAAIAGATCISRRGAPMPST